MKRIVRHIFLLIFLLSSANLCMITPVSADEDESVYTTLRSIDLGTYNEYRYRMTEQFFALKQYYQIHGMMNPDVLRQIAVYANEGYKYLPDNLENKNKLNNLFIEIQKGLNGPYDDAVYVSIVERMGEYVEDVQISSISGQVTATPNSGNAPLSTTLRAELSDPSGTQILGPNITWWVDNGGVKQVIGRGSVINYTFTQEGNFSVFLDATSSHRNEQGNIDVLPFRQKLNVAVQEKIASVIVKVSGDRVRDGEELKFSPSEASYGLLFDASSSTPTDGTRFLETRWDFGNGIRKSYEGSPKLERVPYGREGDYPVKLELYTNEGKIVEHSFMVYIRDPIAQIEVDREDGYIGDTFTFSAKTSGIYGDLTYRWTVIDIDTDEVIYEKSDKSISYVFNQKGKYNIQLRTRRASGEKDEDTRIVYVTSQAPIAEFSTKIPYDYLPNKVFFDASRTYDPDYSDDNKLKYQWIIDGNKVNLAESQANGSIGYYTFDSIGNHSVTLEVTDPDGIRSIKQSTVDIDSILAVEMFAFPRVTKREGFIKFTAQSPEADIYEWDFGDGKSQGGSMDSVTHTYERSGSFDVKLKVSDKNGNTNTYTRTVYVSDSESPFALIDVNIGNLESLEYQAAACNGNGAYVVSRVDNISFDGSESINIDGETSGLAYSWKIGNSKYATSSNVTHRFDEIGCFPVKLTVQSEDNKRTHSSEIMVEVRNLKPSLTSLKIDVTNPEEDPLIVNVTAQGANDADGVIQSYLWYYYTDIDREPQDFRSTVSSSTTFVLPKITGNYYFVAILKDNNEARITSEEATGSKYYTTITGDNINTPIVELAVNDNSVVIGEEVTFTAKAQNILGQDVGKDAEYSWDFDGDGFYDTQTSEGTVNYIYKKSGEFYAKVKVKYKGISSTKNLTMNVSNKLVADFGYISIGNKYIFFDTSLGTIDARTWDLGDGVKKSATNFEYEFPDNGTQHEVTLTITEGTKVKEVTKTVQKNIRNILSARGKTLSVFTYPTLSEDDSVTLESSSDNFFVYLGESEAPAYNYVIDYDIENDSDLNGGMDDDEDNKGTASYVAGDIMAIPLNAYSTQTIRVYTKDESGTVLAVQDITIHKTYIEDILIDPDTIIFEDVTESEREKIEQLKSMVSHLSQQQKMTVLSYIQKLQENWNDETEKTRTILDLEAYIFELGLVNESEFISLLESLLVEGQEDQSEKQIIYQALVNLIPADIECEVETGTCYDNLVSKLWDIKDSSDLDYNRALGTEILEVIKLVDEEKMTNDQKLDFKAILQSLVYGSVDEIPEEEKQEIIDENPNVSDDAGSGILGKILSAIMWIVIIFSGIILALYIAYLLIGKKQNKSFSEFILRTTSFEDSDVESSGGVDEFEDILGTTKKEESKQENDIFASAPSQTKVEEKTKPSDSVVKEDVPDWLKGSFSSDEKAKIPPKKDAEKKIPERKSPDTKPPVKKGQESKQGSASSSKQKTSPKQHASSAEKSEPVDVPDWLKSTGSDVPAVTPETQVNLKTDSDSQDMRKELDAATQLDDTSNVPDWLKGSFDSDSSVKAEKKEDGIPQEADLNPETSKVESPVEDTSKTDAAPQDDANVPDWLKGSFDSDSSVKAEKKEDGIPQEADPNPETSKVESPVEDTSKTDAAPQDDANVPDWLKGSFDSDTSVKAEKKEDEAPWKADPKPETPKVESPVEDTPKTDAAPQDDANVPDWLKDGFDSQVFEKSDEGENLPVEDAPVKSENSDTPETKKRPRKRTRKKKTNSNTSEKSSDSVDSKTPEGSKQDNTLKSNSSSDDTSSGDELWDDGMKIPDWLKSDDDK